MLTWRIISLFYRAFIGITFLSLQKLFLKGQKCYTDKCPVEQRNYPPGQHGVSRRAKVSEYGIQLREKQKIKRSYGLLETQFRNYFEKANKLKGITGDNLVKFLESSRLYKRVNRLNWLPALSE